MQECSPVNLLHFFRTPLPKNTYGWLLLFYKRIFLHVVSSPVLFVNRYFAFGVFECKIGTNIHKKILKVYTIDFLFVIVTPFNVNEFGEVLAFAFKVTTDLIPSQVFLTFVEYFRK